MTDDQLDALEAAAKAATPGPWRHPGRALVVSRMSEDEPLVCDCISKQFAQAPKDAAFIAAANPAVVLELIAELRQTRAERDWLVERMPNNICPDGKSECDARVPTAGGRVCYSCLLCWLNAAKEATCRTS